MSVFTVDKTKKATARFKDVNKEYYLFSIVEDEYKDKVTFEFKYDEDSKRNIVTLTFSDEIEVGTQVAILNIVMR